MVRRPTICFFALALLPALALTACTRTEQPASFGRMSVPDLKRPLANDDQSAPASPFVRGTAKVISLDQTLGYVRLEIDGTQVDAYWQTEVAAAQGGFVALNDSVRPPVGVYREAEVHAQSLRAKPGDIVAFMGMRTGNSIFLQGIAVISR
jgi:hypothetical protein